MSVGYATKDINVKDFICGESFRDSFFDFLFFNFFPHIFLKILKRVSLLMDARFHK